MPLDTGTDEDDGDEDRQRRMAHAHDDDREQQVANQLHGDGPAHSVPHQTVIDEGLQEQRAHWQPSQLLRLVMDAEPQVRVDPHDEHPGEHGEMHRIDPKDPAGQEGADPAPLDAAVHCGEDEPAEDEEDVDAGVAVMGEPGP